MLERRDNVSQRFQQIDVVLAQLAISKAGDGHGKTSLEAGAVRQWANGQWIIGVIVQKGDFLKNTNGFGNLFYHRPLASCSQDQQIHSSGSCCITIRGRCVRRCVLFQPFQR